VDAIRSLPISDALFRARTATPQGRNGSLGRPVFVVGVARSGTTWIGNVLGRAEGAIPIMEPDNVDSEPIARAALNGLHRLPLFLPGDALPSHYARLWDVAFSGGWPKRHPFSWVRDRARRLPWPVLRATYPPLAVASVAARRRLRLGAASTSTVVVKSVLAILALERLWEIYQPRVVVVRRNLFAVANSHADRGWGLNRMGERLDVQERLVRPLGLPEHDIAAPPISRKAWELGLLSRMLEDACSRHPEWPVVWHEDAVASPHAEFRSLFDDVGLTWAESAERFIDENRRESRPKDRGAPDRRWVHRYDGDAVRRMTGVYASFGLDPRAYSTE